MAETLRRVFTIGEPLTPNLRNHFFERLGAAVELHNLYGPTEAAVQVTHYQCMPNEVLHSIPIGRPIANTQVYVLDERGRPQPIGVPGELYLGGVCVARGYLNQPERTAERFIPDPFVGTANTNGARPARLYRTGDRGRWRRWLARIPWAARRPGKNSGRTRRTAGGRGRSDAASRSGRDDCPRGRRPVRRLAAGGLRRTAQGTSSTKRERHAIVCRQ